ncbi:uncharacterized protein LOC110841192 [Zootermopsis nevadensis]|uniref:uncharacterized protein LOC110841192 n=1 Tax=Zootermopsis nevadensis TaxID=136037 RepID=UPI000B8E6EEB|nr:uncharacterized protein LOC110841192 [Zootermopsis nevadensis]
MTVMLLQHAALQYYKPPPLPSKDTCTQQQHMSTPPPVHRNASLQAFKTSCNTKAMRYYRLWIYTCNAVLLVSVLGFAIVAGRIVVADPRRYLVPGLSLYQPSFLYAYLALATQSGLLQLVGCLGALRLNERLLNIYWLLLLMLLFGDAIVGIVWVFRFDKICADLRPTLKQRLAAEYGVDADFTTLWNALQRDYKCCGVDGVQDFEGGVVNRTQGVPESCCRFPPLPTTLTVQDHQHHHHRHQTMTERRPPLGGTPTLKMYPNLPSPPSASAASSFAENGPLNHVISPEEEAETNRVPADTTTTQRLPPPFQSDTCVVTNVDESHVYTSGCESLLLFWLRQSADVLFVLGYCVIAFLKLCFLGILRYEIKEMIQKIKVLQGEMRTPQLLLTEFETGQSPITSPTTTTRHLEPLLMNHHESNNGNIVIGSNGGMITVAGNTTSPPPQIRHGGAASCGSERSGNAVLLLQPPDSLQTTPLHHVSAQHQRHLTNDGTDSDTNSNCALIISEDSRPLTGKTKQPRGSNGNNNYELHEFQELNRLLARHQSQI